MKKLFLVLLIIILLLIITNPTNVKRHEEAYLQNYFKQENIIDFRQREQIRIWSKDMFSINNYILFSIGVKTEPTDLYNVTFGILTFVFTI